MKIRLCSFLAKLAGPCWQPCNISPGQTKTGLATTAHPNTLAGRLRIAGASLLLLLTLPTVVQAQFIYITNNGAITIIEYTGPGGAVTIPDKINGWPVTTIGAEAFEFCDSLISVTMGTNVTIIGDYAFTYCTSLTNITIGNSVTNIGGGAFSDCTSLSAITVATNNPAFCSVDGVLFNKSTNTLLQCPGGKAGSYTISNSVISIEDGAFSECAGLTSVTISDSVTNIGECAFYYCTSLSSVTIGNGVTRIGYFAFASCTNLSSNVTIPTTATDIGNGAFSDCTSLTAITVDALNPAYSSVAGVLFNKSTNTLLQCPGGKAGSYTIPNSVTNIGNNAFEFCANLTSVTIGNSVTSIGGAAFALCDSLTNVTIGNNVTSIGAAAFYACGLNNVTIPNSVTSIANETFESCANLSSVTIGNSVTNIGNEAFLGCHSLSSVTIGRSVVSIGDEAFGYCTSLTGVYFKCDVPSFGYLVFYPENNVTFYYLPGAMGWGGTSAVLWNPQAQTSDTSFGVRTNRFGFNITGTSGLVIVVEACTNLANPAWSPVGTNPVTGGSCYFSDPTWTNDPGRFYRLRSP